MYNITYPVSLITGHMQHSTFKYHTICLTASCRQHTHRQTANIDNQRRRGRRSWHTAACPMDSRARHGYRSGPRTAAFRAVVGHDSGTPAACMQTRHNKRRTVLGCFRHPGRLCKAGNTRHTRPAARHAACRHKPWVKFRCKRYLFRHNGSCNGRLPVRNPVNRILLSRPRRICVATSMSRSC